MVQKDFQAKLRRELVGKGILSEEKFEKTLQESARSRKSFIEMLYHTLKDSEEDLVGILSGVFGYPLINVATFLVDAETLKLIPKDVSVKHQVLPVTRFEKTLTVAIADPTNVAALDDIKALVGLRLKPVLAAPGQLESAIKKYYGAEAEVSPPRSDSFEKITDEVRMEIMSQDAMRHSQDLADLLEEANATPVIRLVNHILIEAIRRHSSDIFIEPWEKNMRIRYRIDGILEEILSTAQNFASPVVSRIKVMSRLNIAEHRIPQDGRFKARIFGREVDVRVSILPTSHGEKACLRLLDTSAKALSLEELGFGESEMDIIRRASSRPHGMILLTGPTGSGKTTTLYAILQSINTPEKNITTVEDPIEYQVPGINQVNVRDSVGLSFPVALRSILRQDPDVILIGEIRDFTTMDIAVKSALTGHLVLSTLHTNDATSAVVRMIDMGVEPFLIASSVVMISAQRLVRQLCPLCRVPYKPDPNLLEMLGLSSQGPLTFYRAKGCNRCRLLGMKGRTLITELFEITPSLRELIMRGASNEEIRNLARESGMKTLRENGLEKVKAGITTVEEVLRVTTAEGAPRPTKKAVSA